MSLSNRAMELYQQQYGSAAPGTGTTTPVLSSSPSPTRTTHSSLPEAQRLAIEAHLANVTTPEGKTIQVNASAAPMFQALLNKAGQLGYRISEIGGYEDRDINQMGKTLVGHPSNHARGNAIDINPKQNTQAPAGQAKKDIPDELVNFGKSLGFEWGGDYGGSTPKDYMHFEWKKSNAEAEATAKRFNLAAAAIAPLAATGEHTVAAKSGGLAPKEQAFVDKYRPEIEAAASKYGVPVNFMVAQAANETGWGTNDSFRNKNNPAGIGGYGNYKKYATTAEGFDAMAKWLTTKWGIKPTMSDQEAAVAVSTGDHPWADARYRLGSTGSEKDTVPETTTRDKYKGIKGTEGQALFSIIDKVRGAPVGGLASGHLPWTGKQGVPTPGAGELPSVDQLPFAMGPITKGVATGYEPTLAESYAPTDMSPVSSMTAKFANMLNPAYVPPLERNIVPAGPPSPNPVQSGYQSTNAAEYRAGLNEPPPLQSDYQSTNAAEYRAGLIPGSGQLPQPGPQSLTAAEYRARRARLGL